MYLALLFNYYMVGRLLFGLALLLPLQMTGFLAAIPQLLWVVVIYIGVAFLRMLTSGQKINYFDFLLDIVFVTALVYLTFRLSSYLTLLYLFPIFFSSLVISTRRIFLFPTVAIILYTLLYVMQGGREDHGGILDPSLHGFAFFVIAIAGHALKERIERQEAYISRLEDERARMQGYERLFRVSADLAHELRNPLASISASVQFLREGSCDPELVEMLSGETRRLASLVDNFLLYARPSEAPVEPLELNEIFQGVHVQHPEAKHLEILPAGSFIVTANRMFLDVALANIIQNALDAARSRVVVTLSELPEQGSREIRQNRSVVITVEDDGPGVPVGERDRIFEPFVTTKARGTGLGLSIAYRVVAGYGGLIMIDDSALLGGARFSIILPLSGE